MVLARGVDHCRAGDDAHRVPLDSFNPEYPRANGLELVRIFAPSLIMPSRF